MFCKSSSGNTQFWFYTKYYVADGILCRYSEMWELIWTLKGTVFTAAKRLKSALWMRPWKGTRMVLRRRWKMNPEAFMLLDRLGKLMCSPQSQHPSSPFLGPVASMSRVWKGTLLKFGGEVGEGRVHLEDTFSVPLGSFQSGWPTSPTLWPDSLAVRVPSVRALTGPPLARAFFVDFSALCL